MALKTLEGVKEIDGFTVVAMDKLRAEFPEKFNESGSMDYKWFEKDIRPVNFVYVRQDVHSISFTLQNGPVKTAGVNGCQVDTMISAAKLIIEGLNKQFPCAENEAAIAHLSAAVSALKARKKDRERRGVEGEDKA